MAIESKLFVLMLFLIMLSCAPKSKQIKESVSDKSLSNYELVWQDEFDSPGLPDSAKWIYDTEGNAEGWGNQEEQYYTEKRIENTDVKDGILHIIALKEDYKNRKYTSARLVSRADWKYGRIEVNAKLPSGRGTWAAIWMMPGGWSFNDGDWPNIGEFDIMEHVGYEPGIIHASAHSTDYQWQTGTQKTDTVHITNATDIFHSYIWEWTPELVKAYVDNRLYFEYANEGLGKSKWPYDKPFYLILNLAVGGAWGSVKGIDDSVFPQIMEVDYVRIYQKKEK